MTVFILSQIKRFYLRYGNIDSVFKTIIFFAIIVGIFIFVDDTKVEDNYNGQILMQEDFQVSSQKETGQSILHQNNKRQISSSGCKTNKYGKCINPNKNKNKNGKKSSNKWISKFNTKKINNKKQIENKNSIVKLPERIIGQSKPIKSIYSKDQIIQQNTSWTLEDHLERRKIFIKRQKDAKKACNKRKYNYLQIISSTYDVIKWTPKYHVLYCPIFKAASTTWMKNFLMLAGEQEVKGSLHARVRELFSLPLGRGSRNLILKKSLKMIIVRHPFERLLSAYRDKMLRVTKNEDTYKTLQINIFESFKHCSLKTYNESDPMSCSSKNSVKNISEVEMVNRIDPQIKEEIKRSNEEILSDIDKHPSFLQFLMQVKVDLENYIIKLRRNYVDSHWMPMSQSCSPCMLHYDVIAHMETLEKDQEYIIHETGLDNILTNSHTHASRFDNFNNTNSAISQYFSQIPTSLLKQLYNLYIADFIIFGYSPEEYYKISHAIKSVN